MKTKREVLKHFAEYGNCEYISCTDCSYYENYKHCPNDICTLKRIGAMAILRQNRKKREFDPNKVLTCVTANQAKVGMKGYFADDLASLRKEFAQKIIRTLTRILSEKCYARFGADNKEDWVLFYPIEEELTE